MCLMRLLKMSFQKVSFAILIIARVYILGSMVYMALRKNLMITCVDMHSFQKCYYSILIISSDYDHNINRQ